MNCKKVYKNKNKIKKHIQPNPSPEKKEMWQIPVEMNKRKRKMEYKIPNQIKAYIFLIHILFKKIIN